jgi:hypothetical protein
MNLPNYFLADLPPEAPLSPAIVGEACRALKANRARYLANRATPDLISLLSRVGADWLEAGCSFRKIALEQGPAATGFSAATLASGLDAFFSELTPQNFQALLEQDLGHAQRLDLLASSPAEQAGHRASLAAGPDLLAHFASGNPPNSVLASMVIGLLARSAQFVKCTSGTSLLARLFAHSLYEADSKIASCLEIAEWRNGNAPLEQALFVEADGVTAVGSDGALAEIRSCLPAPVRFLGYSHRVSFAFIASEVLSSGFRRKVLEEAATEVVAWDQLGGLSPHVLYIQKDGAITPEQFAELLAGELARREESVPRGKLSAETAAAIASRRSLYEIRATQLDDTRLWSSPGSTAWSVVYEADPSFQTSCLHRFIYVKPAKDLSEVLQNAASIRGKIATVGLAAPEHQIRQLAVELARWGVPRVCPLGRMQRPPLTWRHAGRPTLADLLTWTDWEQ